MPVHILCRPPPATAQPIKVIRSAAMALKHRDRLPRVVFLLGERSEHFTLL
jgi:hypothetical protein